MAPRFDGNASNRWARTTNLFSYNGLYSVAFMFYFSVDRAAISALIAITDGTTNNRDRVNLSAARAIQASVVVAGAATNITGPVLTVGNWYHVACVRESVTSFKVYVDAVLEATNTRDVTGRTAQTVLNIGADNTSNPLNGRIADIKMWDGKALTLAEIQAERYATLPIIRENLQALYPGWNGASERVRDYSGNGYNFTEIGTITDEDGAPVFWEPFRPYIIPRTATGNVYVDTGSVTGTARASGADQLILTEIGSAVSVARASGLDSAVFTEIGLARSIASASVADLWRINEIGTAVSGAVGSSVTQWIAVDIGRATAVFSVVSTHVFSSIETGAIVGVFSVSGADSIPSAVTFLVMPTKVTLINSGETQIEIYGS